MKVKIDLLAAVAVMACASVALPAMDVPYPSEKLAALVVEKLDVTSLPGTYRPKKEKGKKTLVDYGYTVEKLDEKEALVEAASAARKLSIKILQEGPTGIYACIAEPARSSADPKSQSVVLLKRKDANELLKGRETWREFKSCPVIGGTTNDFETY